MSETVPYQLVTAESRLFTARFVFWTGLILASVGTLVMFIAVIENLQYYNRYPLIDILLFAFGVTITPAVGWPLLFCGIYIRHRSRAACTIGACLLVLIALLCLCVIPGAVVEASESFTRGARIDALTTLVGGGTIMIAMSIYALWLAFRSWSLRRKTEPAA